MCGRDTAYTPVVVRKTYHAIAAMSKPVEQPQKVYFGNWSVLVRNHKPVKGANQGVSALFVLLKKKTTLVYESQGGI